MKKFKTESKKVLDLMINSIYTNKEVFLRELISNASDALDKLYFTATAEGLPFAREDFKIEILVDKAARTLTVRDNGCGMTADDLEENLGVIAHSDSESFKKGKGSDADIDIIGQFGVGFYSAFMVAKEIKVTTKKYNSQDAFMFISDGSDGYDVKKADKSTVGTDVTLTLRDDADDEKYTEFLDAYKLESLVKKYSDYIRYPIILARETEKLKEGTKDEYETVVSMDTVNSMVPLWKRAKSEVTDAEYAAFYKDKFHDFEDPACVITTSVEGMVNYRATLFAPARQPYNYYSKDYEKGLQLYTKGVLIMEKCADLLDDCFGFVRGVVDTEDISLNISREVLQHNRVLRVIASGLEKKIKSELAAMLSDSRDKYEKLFENFGTALKFGVYNSFGAKSELLSDLLLFRSAKTGKYVTLNEYIDGMQEGQDAIYYGAAKSADAVKSLPQAEAVLDKGYDVLCFTDHVDEFVAKTMQKFKDKEFKSIQDNAAPIETAAESAGDKELIAFIKECLVGKVSNVVLSERLKTHPVCLSSEGEISIEMEKVFKGLNKDMSVEAQKVLELNKNHSVFASLQTAFAADREKAASLVSVLYSSALLIEGLTLDNVASYVDTVAKLIGG